MCRVAWGVAVANDNDFEIDYQCVSIKKVIDITTAPFCHLQQLYECEFSVVTQSEVNDEGLYCQQALIDTWSTAGFDVYLFYYGRLPVGFCVVNLSSMISNDHLVRDMAEFFILPLYRRHGLGRYCAQEVFNCYLGPWEVRQLGQLHSARNFWCSVIGNHTRGDFRHAHINTPQWTGYIQYFTSVCEK